MERFEKYPVVLICHLLLNCAQCSKTEIMSVSLENELMVARVKG